MGRVGIGTTISPDTPLPIQDWISMETLFSWKTPRRRSRVTPRSVAGLSVFILMMKQGEWACHDFSSRGVLALD